MKEETSIADSPLTEKHHISKRALAASAVAIFGVGAALPLAGLVLAVVHSLIDGDRAYGVIGTVCLIATIPMIMLGTHLMDVFDSAK